MGKKGKKSMADAFCATPADVVCRPGAFKPVFAARPQVPTFLDFQQVVNDIFDLTCSNADPELPGSAVVYASASLSNLATVLATNYGLSLPVLEKMPIPMALTKYVDGFSSVGLGNSPIQVSDPEETVNRLLETASLLLYSGDLSALSTLVLPSSLAASRRSYSSVLVSTYLGSNSLDSVDSVSSWFDGSIPKLPDRVASRSLDPDVKSVLMVKSTKDPPQNQDLQTTVLRRLGLLRVFTERPLPEPYQSRLLHLQVLRPAVDFLAAVHRKTVCFGSTSDPCTKAFNALGLRIGFLDHDVPAFEGFSVVPRPARLFSFGVSPKGVPTIGRQPRHHDPGPVKDCVFLDSVGWKDPYLRKLIASVTFGLVPKAHRPQTT